jgi:hypothetical protein
MAGGPAPSGPSASPLGQAWGYGIVLGIGFLFALGMIATTWVLKRYNNELQTSEMFSTAGRTVKSGLVASAVVSSWTWAATLLQSTSVAFRYGMPSAIVCQITVTEPLRCLRSVLVRFWCHCTDPLICHRGH